MVTRAQLLNAGFSHDQVHRWVKAGRLITVHRGVYALGHLPPSPHAKTMAALLACGPTAVLSHRSAAKLWGLMRYDGPIEVTASVKRDRPGIIVHRHRLKEHEITRHWGLPVTTAARTLQDLATTLSPAALTRAVNDARLRSVLNVADLPPKLRKDQTPRPTKSALEDAFRAFIARHHLPEPEVNTIVAGYEVDMYWPHHKLVGELDGYDTHEPRFEEDRERDADLLTYGVRVIRVTWERLHEKTAREAARFARLLG
jgi:very-short-patch-repair endonuclease